MKNRHGGKQAVVSAKSVGNSQTYTRDWGLLVRDQVIVDLVYSKSPSEMYELAGTFVAIQDAIAANDVKAIEKIGRQSRSRPYREVISAIKGGLAAGDAWSADFTASAVVEEAFSKTVPYFRALRAFCAGLRATSARASKAPMGGGKQK